jgi:hypothetical protein
MPKSVKAQNAFLKTPKHAKLINISLTPSDKKHLRPFSNSRLTDMNQCPTWGTVHSQRVYSSTARAMALEAGEAMHQVFAAIRIWQLDRHQRLPKHALVTATRIFGLARWKHAVSEMDKSLDDREQLLQLAFAILHGSGFYDDPSDNIRTLGNMEMATITYVDEVLPKMDNWPIWVADKKNPNCAVGIEQVFDVMLTYDDGKAIRFIGTIDGLVLDTYRENKPTLDENKTASRLDDGWINSFDMSHQVTGYIASASVAFGLSIWHSRITGLKIKPTHKGEDVYVKRVSRTQDTILHWGAWVRHTVDLYETYEGDWENAPRYTHSCNRYFRPCSLLSFCADSADGRAEQWAQMVPNKGSPSERAVREI